MKWDQETFGGYRSEDGWLFIGQTHSGWWRLWRLTRGGWWEQHPHAFRHVDDAQRFASRLKTRKTLPRRNAAW